MKCIVTFQFCTAHLYSIQQLPISNKYNSSGGEDFTFINGQTIIIPAEQSSVNVSISIINDSIVEAQRETFLFKLTSILPRVTVDGQDSIVVSITDNDGLLLLISV